MPSRVYFLDNLRAFLIFLVILFHAGFVYQMTLRDWWPVIDPAQNESLGLIGMYIDLFVMHGLFFISGFFISSSVTTKSNWEFLKSKFKRIMVPWILGVLTLIPAYKVIFLYSRGLPQEQWFYYFHFFQKASGDLNFANYPNQNWLWFLPVLFLYQVLYWVLFKARMLSMNISLKTAVATLLVIGTAYSMIIAGSGWMGWVDTALLHFQRERFLVYFMVFLLGSLCYRQNVLDHTNLNIRYYIISNLILFIGLAVYTVVSINFFFNITNPGRNYFFISELIDGIFYYGSSILSMLCFLHILVYTFQRWFNGTGKLMIQLSRNSYYVYVIHLVVMGLIALVLVDLELPVFVKYLLLAILTFVVSNFLVSAYYVILDNLSESTETKELGIREKEG